ncbi:putative dead deah box rna helicase [Phaeomoniella chlamydospora]|uniref:RNA helicase n=1 Tax=Phaeomoniella chlamydospora TaxID=158046 RepID=A0A0G2EX81_PHACM|nr:putative dead deah box rna helicase [Phaeomoniella chlamydospora]
MSDTFDHNDMAAALDKAAAQAQPAARTEENEANAAKARERGWTAPQGYDYASYNAAPVRGQEDLTEWGHKAAKYEWKDDFGDVGPAVEELEKQLFRSELRMRQGTKLDNLISINVTAESVDRPKPIKSFNEAGLHPMMVKNIELCGYQVPTPIQAYTIPAVLTGRDVIGIAQTGSGKTAAFLIPAISKLIGKVKKLAAPRVQFGNWDATTQGLPRGEPLILVVAPTRELCIQIFDDARRLCYRSMLRPCVAYGGGPKRDQKIEIQNGCDILIATPGRLIDLMNDSHVLSLARVKYTIIDEADEMLQSDWEEEMTKIMSGGDTNEDADHRYLMFSATFNKDLRSLARAYLSTDFVRIRIGRAGSTHINVKQQLVFVNRDMKNQALYDLLISMPPSRTIIFVNTKKTADFVDDYVFNNGLPSTSIHSDRTQQEREDALRAFRTGKAPILVATGVSARGLDIRNVMHVVNYDLPSYIHGGINEYIHRIGRTARIGNEGLATSFYNDRDEDIAEDLIKILLESGQPIPDFLEDRQPAQGQPLDFNDDTDNEGDAQNGDNEAGGHTGAAAAPADDAW